MAGTRVPRSLNDKGAAALSLHGASPGTVGGSREQEAQTDNPAGPHCLLSPLPPPQPWSQRGQDPISQVGRLRPHNTAKAPTPCPLGVWAGERPAHLLSEKAQAGDLGHHTW